MKFADLKELFSRYCVAVGIKEEYSRRDKNGSYHTATPGTIGLLPGDVRLDNVYAIVSNEELGSISTVYGYVSSDRLAGYMDAAIITQQNVKPNPIKTYCITYGIGKSKYVVSYNDGVKTHPDGSLFYDIELFSNKSSFNNFISELQREGYKKM